MTINKQFYEDACKLIEQDGAWIKGSNFGKNGEEIHNDNVLGSEMKKNSNCWCFNGALAVTIMKSDEALDYWWGSINDRESKAVPEEYEVYNEHFKALNNAFYEKYGGDSFIHVNDGIAKSGADMAKRVREVVEKM